MKLTKTYRNGGGGMVSVDVKSAHDQWLNTFKSSYDESIGEGGFLVLFPEYRPDMTRALAHSLGLKFYDYRLEKMRVQGWEAGDITLESLMITLIEESTHIGLVVHNVEALLATKSEGERVQWLRDFLAFDWPNPVVVPLSIFQADADKSNLRVCDLELIEFEKESFLMRLAMN